MAKYTAEEVGRIYRVKQQSDLGGCIGVIVFIMIASALVSTCAH